MCMSGQTALHASLLHGITLTCHAEIVQESSQAADNMLDLLAHRR